jgi:uncharacterized protein DUF4326
LAQSERPRRAPHIFSDELPDALKENPWLSRDRLAESRSAGQHTRWANDQSAEHPPRIRLSRATGWRMPENTVKVDRTTKWGNPLVIGRDGTRSECIHLYRCMIEGSLAVTKGPGPLELANTRRFIAENIDRLRGKKLACWCSLPKEGEPDLCVSETCEPARASALCRPSPMTRRFGYRPEAAHRAHHRRRGHRRDLSPRDHRPPLPRLGCSRRNSTDGVEHGQPRRRDLRSDGERRRLRGRDVGRDAHEPDDPSSMSPPWPR